MRNLGLYYNKLYFDRLHSIPANIGKKQFSEQVFAINSKLTMLNESVDLQIDTLKLKQAPMQECLELTTTYPGLLTGIGLGHDFEADGALMLGFYFDYTTGLPIIPGSTIKGVLRSAFPQWEESKEKSNEKIQKTNYIFEKLKEINPQKYNNTNGNAEAVISLIKRIEANIFDGILSSKEKINLPIYQRDIFFDAYITKGTSSVPKQNKILGLDAITPHIQESTSYKKSMLKNPIPLPFLKVLPGVTFMFEFNLKEMKEIDNKGNEIVIITENEKLNLFKSILLDIGIGAKTNVGYGQFKEIEI